MDRNGTGHSQRRENANSSDDLRTLGRFGNALLFALISVALFGQYRRSFSIQRVYQKSIGAGDEETDERQVSTLAELHRINVRLKRLESYSFDWTAKYQRWLWLQRELPRVTRTRPDVGNRAVPEQWSELLAPVVSDLERLERLLDRPDSPFRDAVICRKSFDSILSGKLAGRAAQSQLRRLPLSASVPVSANEVDAGSKASRESLELLMNALAVEATAVWQLTELDVMQVSSDRPDWHSGSSDVHTKGDLLQWIQISEFATRRMNYRELNDRVGRVRRVGDGEFANVRDDWYTAATDFLTTLLEQDWRSSQIVAAQTLSQPEFKRFESGWRTRFHLWSLEVWENADIPAESAVQALDLALHLQSGSAEVLAAFNRLIAEGQQGSMTPNVKDDTQTSQWVSQRRVEALRSYPSSLLALCTDAVLASIRRDGLGDDTNRRKTLESSVQRACEIGREVNEPVASTLTSLAWQALLEATRPNSKATTDDPDVSALGQTATVAGTRVDDSALKHRIDWSAIVDAVDKSEATERWSVLNRDGLLLTRAGWSAVAGERLGAMELLARVQSSETELPAIATVRALAATAD